MEDNKELTLRDLNPNIVQEEVKIKPVSIKDIIPDEPPTNEDIKHTPMDDIFTDLDTASDTAFEEAKDIVIGMYEQRELQEIETESEYDLSEIRGSHADEDPEQKDYIDNNEIDDDTDVDINDFDDDDTERLNIIKADIKEKINPFMKKIDIASFTISSKPSKVHKLFEQKLSTDNIADWVLFSTGISISMREFKAIDIEKLSPDGSSQNKINTYRTIYRQLYEHLDGDGIPEFEIWLKMVHYYDLDHLYMAAFYASFGKSNLIPYMCDNPKCSKKAFVKQFDNIWEMVKFDNIETERKFHSILEGDTSFRKDAIETELVQLSDNYVVGLKIPTLYSIIYEQYSLSEQYQDRNRDVLGLITFIDTIYNINYDTGQFEPIYLKTFDKDIIKTIHYKIKTYKDILESITSDQYFYLQQLISNLSKNSLAAGISYQLPEAECPSCGHKQEAQSYTGESLLFMRHRLPGIANI